jgi:hypothetical protein
MEVRRSTIDLLKGRFDLSSTTHPSSVLIAKTGRMVSSSAAESCTPDVADWRHKWRCGVHHLAILVDQPKATKPCSDTSSGSLVLRSKKVDRPATYKAIVKLTIFIDSPRFALPWRESCN